MARDGTGVPLLRHGEQLELPCLKSMEGVGPKGLSGIPRVVGTWAFPSPGPKELPQSMPEWAKASRHWPVSTSQAWERGAVAPVLFEARAPLPKTGGDNFSGYEKAEEEGRESMLPLAHEGATSSSPSFQAPNSWEGGAKWKSRALLPTKVAEQNKRVQQPPTANLGAANLWLRRGL